MRTNTVSFRKTVCAAIRDLGVSSACSREMAARISDGLSNGTSTLGEGTSPCLKVDDIQVKLNIGFGTRQSLDVFVDGAYLFSAASRSGRIVSTEATGRQLLLAERMKTVRQSVLTACGNACRAWDETNGHPTDDESADRRHDEIGRDLSYMAAKKEFAILRDESAAINPHAPARVVDEMSYATFSDWYKEETGHRPGADWTYRQVVDWLDNRMSEPAGRAA